MTIEEIHLQNLHYFFSTAPQVLGAILAITGAYVVFKIDSLKKELFSGGSQQLINFDNEDNSIYHIFFDNKDKQIIREAQSKGNEVILRKVIASNYKKLTDETDEYSKAKNNLELKQAEEKNGEHIKQEIIIDNELKRYQEVQNICAFILQQTNKQNRLIFLIL